jgi:hypothetical protein
MTYRLVGGPFEAPDINLKMEVLGQSAELDEKLAEELIAGGAGMLPATQFAELIADDEAKKYPSAVSQQKAPPEFQEKLMQARIAVHDLRTALLAPKKEN